MLIGCQCCQQPSMNFRINGCLALSMVSHQLMRINQPIAGKGWYENGRTTSNDASCCEGPPAIVPDRKPVDLCDNGWPCQTTTAPHTVKKPVHKQDRYSKNGNCCQIPSEFVINHCAWVILGHFGSKKGSSVGMRIVIFAIYIQLWNYAQPQELWSAIVGAGSHHCLANSFVS